MSSDCKVMAENCWTYNWTNALCNAD